MKMNSLLEEYSIKYEKITKYKAYYIVEDSFNNKKYLIRKRNSNNKEIINYLESINYPYYLPIINSYEDNYLIYPFYEDINISKDKEIIKAIGLLEKDSISYVEYLDIEIDKYYKEKVEELDSLMNYYSLLQDNLEENELSPSSYLLLINMSCFYKNLSLARGELEKWYLNKNKKYRTSYVIGNVLLDNFIGGDKNYFINIDNFRRDYFLTDIIFFFRNDILKIDINSLFKYYQEIIELEDYELSFLYFNLLIPRKIEFSNDNYLDTIKIRKEIDSINKIRKFYLEENKEYQETYKDEFKEKDEYI